MSLPLHGIHPKSILQLPDETRERFLELRMVFKARPVQPMSWAHAMVLRLSLAVIAQPSTRSRLCGSSHVCRASGPGVGESEQC